jgi:hypothetical protein
VLVREGDSGAWVVHSTAALLYGHIVATNPFGEAYMIPALDIFENMRECLGATSVTLPTASDLRDARSEQRGSNGDETTVAWHEAGLPPSPIESTLNLHCRTSDDGTLLADDQSTDSRARTWNSVFATRGRGRSDRPFLQVLRSTACPESIIDAFLDPLSCHIPSYELQSVRSFYQQRLTTSYTDPIYERVWHWHTSKHESELELPQWMTVLELEHSMRPNVR